MNWLIEMLISSIREVCSQIVVEMVEIVNRIFMELLSCDLSFFEEVFSVTKALYKNGIRPMGIALLLLICLWQLFKSLFGRMGVEGEDPVQLVLRTCLCMFLIIYARDVVNYVLNIAGTPYQWIVDTKVRTASFSEFTSVGELAASASGLDGMSIQLMMFILLFVVAWNYLKMLFTIAERYVLLGVYSYTSPLAFATGGSNATNSILAGWAKTFGGQVVLIIMNAWSVKMFLSGFGNIMSTGYGFTKFFAANLCLIGFCKIVQKLDSYLASLGINLGRQGNGMGAMGLMMMASRLVSSGSNLFGSGGAGGSAGGSNDGGSTSSEEYGPIPMGGTFGEQEVPGGKPEVNFEGTAREDGTVDTKGTGETGTDERENQSNAKEGEADTAVGFGENGEDETDMTDEGADSIGEFQSDETDALSETEATGMDGLDMQGMDNLEENEAIPTEEGANLANGGDVGRENIDAMEGLNATKEGDMGIQTEESGSEGAAVMDDAHGTEMGQAGGVKTANPLEANGVPSGHANGTVAGSGVQELKTSEGLRPPDGGGSGGRSIPTGGNGQSSEGFRCLERDGERFVRYDADLYDKPDVNYESVEEDGKTYYEVPTSQIPMKTNIQENGRVVVERSYEGAVRRKT